MIYIMNPNNYINDPTGELAFMRNKIFSHVDRLQCNSDQYLHLLGDYIEIYIKELEKQLKEAREAMRNGTE